jgi:tetratricopeptide (TPR) repeat protein
MSLLNGFDVEKFQVLHLFFKQQKQGVWQRALTGLVLGFYLYDQRILFYPKASAIRFQLAEAGLDKEIEHIIIQLIRARDTEKVSKKMQEEIIPEMIKLRPRLEDKLGLENLLKEDELEDKNPEWETFFKDTPGLAEKMEEFSKMQMEGADVFISAFSMLKHFSFFQELSNWFLPFYAENNVAQAAVSQEVNLNDKQGFLEGFEKSVFLCDSDKYSFILNLQQLPEQQKKMMFEMLEAELNQMNELSKQEALSDGVSQNKSIYISHIQNLYRFCKLYPGRRDFEDIFKLSLDVHNSESFSAMVNDPSVIRNIAEFYFEQGHFHDANDIYKKLIDQGEHDAELYEKIGYSCMKQENYEEAIVFFERAELFESNRVWNLRKLALCNRKLKRFDKAIRNYQDALKLEPENTDLQVSLALTYLQIKDFKSALQYYQQLAESYPDNPRFKRPAAWCALNLGAIDLAGSYYEALLASQQNRFDLMNLGHVYWLKGDVRKALQLYVDSIHTEGNSLKAFLIGFEDDKAILKKQGIKAEEISILMDYMRYELL